MGQRSSLANVWLPAGADLMRIGTGLRPAGAGSTLVKLLMLTGLLTLAGSAGGCDSGSSSNGTDGAASNEAAATRPAGPATCTREEGPRPGLLKIAVIPKGTTHEFWKAIHAGAVKAELELQGVQVEWKGPVKEDDRANQISVMENFINRDVAGIALAPLDNKALVRPVLEAGRAGINVVIMDSALDARPCEDYASFVATDNYIGGQKAARRLGELLGGAGRVLVMRYQEGSASTMEREQGFLDTIAKEFPDIQIVSSDQYGGATTESAYAKAENLLGRFPQLDGIFTPNESTTFGMLRALQGSGRAGQLKFVGFDSSEKLAQAMADGQIHGLVLQDPLNMGYMAVKTLAAYLRGEQVDTRIDTGSEVATPENMNEPRIRELLAPPVEKYLGS